MPENNFLARESDLSEREVAQPSTIEVSMMDAEPALEMQAATPEVSSEMPRKAKETDVIDVHAPHGGISTWKEFWIHLGTITLGLLIAISLEQSVEWMHHLHQRHELEASLLAECKTNKDRAEADFSGFDDEMKWLLGSTRTLERCLRAGARQTCHTGNCAFALGGKKG